MSSRRSPMLAAASLLGLLATQAHAQDAAKSWADSISLSGYIQAGITGNPSLSRGSRNLNFGHAFTDRANQVLLNQVALTLQREMDKQATGYDFGFKLQGMLGTDARYTRALGVLERATSGQYQFDLHEANVQMHAPWLTEGGIDFKAGLFTTPLGAETIDPTTNAFYTHSYIFNFGLPLKHTGAMAVIHATSMIDLYLGITTGVNTTFGKWGDNNSAFSGLAGLGLTLMDGKLTVLALTHIGSENPSTVPNSLRSKRYLSDILITYKPNDTWSFSTELNHIREELVGANGYGIAQYVSYALSDSVKLNLRAEVWRDEKGFFVAAFPGNFDFVNAQLGRPATAIGAPRPTTYGGITLGVTYKPGLPGPLAGLMIRPEIRYDSSLNGTKPFNGGRDTGAFTLATDFVLSF